MDLSASVQLGLMGSCVSQGQTVVSACPAGMESALGSRKGIFVNVSQAGRVRTVTKRRTSVCPTRVRMVEPVMTV